MGLCRGKHAEGGKERRWEGEKLRRWEKAGLRIADFGWLKVEKKEDGKELKWEVGMWPPAHRGLRLRPGGKAEKKKVGSGKRQVHGAR
jgi:hypothetical protein